MLLKKFSGEEGERVDVQKLFGYIGLFTLVALWWLGKSMLLIDQIYGTRQTCHHFIMFERSTRFTHHLLSITIFTLAKKS